MQHLRFHAVSVSVCKWYDIWPAKDFDETAWSLAPNKKIVLSSKLIQKTLIIPR